MRKAILLKVVLAAVSLLIACDFTDSDFYVVDPVEDDPPEVSVVTNLDTLFQPKVNDSLQVIYEVSILNGELYYVEAVLSDLRVYASDTTDGSFWIYPSQSSDTGLVNLSMEFYHSSNTNSLADIVGYEALTISKNYTLDFNQGVEP
jgi:hypothetical protein